jgi:protein-disulfide isomerase
MQMTRLISVLLFIALVGSVFYFQTRTRTLSAEVQELRGEVASLKESYAKQNRLVEAINKHLNPPPRTAWVEIDDAPVLGKATAPVTMIEFSEFQCPYCARFATTVMSDIKKEYIDTGKLRFVFRNYPLPFHKYAAQAAEAAACAGDQGMFWEMHDILFQNHDKLDTNDLKSYGEKIGLFMNDYLFCMDSDKHAEEIQKDLTDGRRAGVTGTPTFFIGTTREDGRIEGTLVKGIQPFDTYKTVIEEKLREG